MDCSSVTGRKRDRFVPFPWALVQIEMQTALFRISTKAANSILNVTPPEPFFLFMCWYNDDDYNHQVLFTVQISLSLSPHPSLLFIALSRSL